MGADAAALDQLAALEYQRSTRRTCDRPSRSADGLDEQRGEALELADRRRSSGVRAARRGRALTITAAGRSATPRSANSPRRHARPPSPRADLSPPRADLSPPRPSSCPGRVRRLGHCWRPTRPRSGRGTVVGMAMSLAVDRGTAVGGHHAPGRRRASGASDRAGARLQVPFDHPGEPFGI